MEETFFFPDKSDSGDNLWTVKRLSKGSCPFGEICRVQSLTANKETWFYFYLGPDETKAKYHTWVNRALFMWFSSQLEMPRNKASDPSSRELIWADSYNFATKGSCAFLAAYVIEHSKDLSFVPEVTTCCKVEMFPHSLEQKFRTMKACYMVASNGTAMWNIKEARLSHCMHKTNKNDFQISLKSRITRQELWLNNYGLFIRRGKHSGWTPARMSVRVWELLSLIPWIRTTNSSN